MSVEVAEKIDSSMYFTVFRGRKAQLKVKDLSYLDKPPGGPKYAGISVDVYENKRAKKLVTGKSVEVVEK